MAFQSKSGGPQRNRRPRAAVPARVAFTLALGVGCNAIFSIEEGTLDPNASGGESSAKGGGMSGGAALNGGKTSRGGTSSGASGGLIGNAGGGAAGNPPIEAGAGGLGEGGQAAGGTAAGGTAAGGTSSGGTSSGGKSAGGTSAGGTSSGGTASGGKSSGGTSSGGAASGGKSSGGATSSGGTGAGGMTACTGGTQRCAGTCTNIATSSTHCGACGHDCGGSACTLGVCEPFKLNVQTTTVEAMAVGPTEIYFSTPQSSDGLTPPKLFACPKDGCTLAPRQLASMAYYINPIVYVSGSVVFESAPTQSTTRPNIYGCPEAGCSTPTSLAADGLNGFVGDLFAVGNRVFYNGGGIGIGSTTCSGGTCTPGVTLPSSRGRAALSADATRLAFVDTSANGRNLAMCDYTGGSCTSTPLVTGDFSAVKATQILAGKFYWIQPGRQDFNEGKLRQCALSDSCATIKDLTNGLDFPSTLLVDASGSYWFSATSPKLQHCAPDTCTGGTKDLTGAFTSPSSLTADAKFVYWVSAGAIWRVAKP